MKKTIIAIILFLFILSLMSTQTHAFISVADCKERCKKKFCQTNCNAVNKLIETFTELSKVVTEFGKKSPEISPDPLRNTFKINIDHTLKLISDYITHLQSFNLEKKLPAGTKDDLIRKRNHILLWLEYSTKFYRNYKTVVEPALLAAPRIRSELKALVARKREISDYYLRREFRGICNRAIRRLDDLVDWIIEYELLGRMDNQDLRYINAEIRKAENKLTLVKEFINIKRCGNGECSHGEDYINCPEDCGDCVPLGSIVRRKTPCCLDAKPRKAKKLLSLVPFECSEGLGSMCMACGNQICEKQYGENSCNCPEDCAKCGNKYCEPGENKRNCREDCTVCGDAKCDAGEKPEKCPECSRCGDGKCLFPETKRSCKEDCSGFCGDSICESQYPNYESPNNCPEDCENCIRTGWFVRDDKPCCDQEAIQRRADHVSIYNPSECVESTSLICIKCQNGICEDNHRENICNCPEDCAVCGNLDCERGETKENCPEDCAVCKDGDCNTGIPHYENSVTCPEDCT